MDYRLIDTFKEIALNVYQSQYPADTLAGEVTAIDPLTIRPNNYVYELPAAIIDVPDYFDVIEQTYEIEVPVFRQEGETIIEESRKVEGKCTYDNTLKVGDQVHMISQEGGQRFLVVGRLKQ